LNPSSSAPANNPNITGTFTMSAWVKPQAEITLPKPVASGGEGLNHTRNDLLYPPPGYEVYGEGHSGAGISVGRNGVVVYEHSANYFAPVLVHSANLDNWTHLAIVYKDGIPTL